MTTENFSQPRDGFKSKWGFILACIGSAVGMANVWAFPYRTAAFGGAAFLIPYLICVVILSVTGVVSEISFGRWAGTGPLGAMSKAIKKPGVKHIGIIPVFSAFAIATGYAIIMGWVIRYLWGSIAGSVTSTPDVGAYFGAIAGPFGSVGWHFLALAITVLMMVGGIAKSIEKINMVMMPLFFILFLGMAIYVAFLPGSFVGYQYLFVPKWEFIGNPKTWIFALGQAFFSLSLAGNGTVIYGSYLGKDVDAVGSARRIAAFDTFAAILAACVIIPALFAFNMDPAAGPPLMFMTLPSIFQQMGGFGHLFAILFFAAIFFAAASSIVNLFETPIEMVQSKFKLSRPVSVAIVIVLAAVVGLFLEDGNIIGGWMDVMSIYLCPLGALLAAICFYWVLGNKVAEEQMQLGRTKPLGKWMIPTGKYLYCAIAFLVIVLGIAYGGIG